MTNVTFGSFLLNFGFGTKEEKKSLLARHPDQRVVMDLSCFDPAEFYAEFENLDGAFAALFCDEQKKLEIHFRRREEAVVRKLVELGFTPVETSIVSCGFVFPRTIAQIVNEAFFALEEEVASKEDINRAMRFGVNYPKGPFEWAEGKSAYFLTLLQELSVKTGDARYRPSRLLAGPAPGLPTF
jgi:3-hydroxybutyryl-CoA dehydrogenase